MTDRTYTEKETACRDKLMDEIAEFHFAKGKKDFNQTELTQTRVAFRAMTDANSSMPKTTEPYVKEALAATGKMATIVYNEYRLCVNAMAPASAPVTPKAAKPAAPTASAARE